ncbi:uncharacterized protein JCM15063_006023 [Sporobolomyces koalae]|uniref:uncharacterized protein n=1 Tax=Sporobolomyces koalae TaxID=500713 RepID=UPI0031747C90
MPRSSRAGPPRIDAETPDYFESLQELAAYSSRTRAPPPEDEVQIPIPTRSSRSRQTLVCHDYKGGYSERHDARGYSFQWWHLCHTYIYFSHHRVSCPPRDWIRTAHRHGTAILGTLIFEWDAGRNDIAHLVNSDSTKYADMLVQLAHERGFDGWLVNVEVNLGNDDESSRLAEALVTWLGYLTSEMHKRVPGSQIMWYDAVTTEGKLSWQNCVNDLNLSFLLACDSIFLNYFWTTNEIDSTLGFLSNHHPRISPARVFFGIDLFGRGSYGGGGFDTWRAIEAISSATSSESDSLSIALFAPGWTVEGETLANDNLESKTAYAKWFADELYLWSNGPRTDDSSREAIRMRQGRRDRAGTERARQLANALNRFDSIPIKFRAPIEPLRFNLDDIPDPPGQFQSLSELVPRSNPVSYTSNESVFYTNFASGSGHAFLVQGRAEISSDKGYTDIDYQFAFPSLLFERKETTARVEFVEEEGSVWEGNRSVLIKADGSKLIDVIAMDISLARGRTYAATVVWKSDNEGPSPLVTSTLSLKQNPPRTRPLNAGWNSTTTTFVAETDATRLSKFSLEFSENHSSTCLVGSIAIYPVPLVPNAYRIDVQWNSESSTLYWRTTNVDKEIADKAPSSFSLDDDDLNGVVLVVKGVLADGSTMQGELVVGN